MLIQVNGAPVYAYTGGKSFDAAKPPWSSYTAC